MRRPDLILPALLAISLAVMALYAGTAENPATQLASAASVSCQHEPLDGPLAELAESSGLAASKRTHNLFWSHNDSGDPAIFAIRADGSIVGRVRVAGAAVVDWEAVTVGACDGAPCLYVGDIGDNDLKRERITIYRTPEPLPGDGTTAPAEAIHASYPEGPQDAEALFILNGELFVVTKGEGAPVRVYRVGAGQGAFPGALQLVASLTDTGPRKSERVTDAAVSPTGRWIALRTNDQVLFYRASALVTGHPGKALAYDLRQLREPQGEGIAWGDDRTLYVSGEAPRGGTFGRISCTLP